MPTNSKEKTASVTGSLIRSLQKNHLLELNITLSLEVHPAHWVRVVLQ